MLPMPCRRATESIEYQRGPRSSSFWVPRNLSPWIGKPAPAIHCWLREEVKYGVRSPKFIWAPRAQLYSLTKTPQPPPLPQHLGSYSRALLVIQDRRHHFVGRRGKDDRKQNTLASLCDCVSLVKVRRSGCNGPKSSDQVKRPSSSLQITFSESLSAVGFALPPTPTPQQFSLPSLCLPSLSFFYAFNIFILPFSASQKDKTLGGKAKCRHLKKLTCKVTLRQVFICLEPH